MATFQKATIGDKIDDVKCPQCNESELRLAGLHLIETDKPLVVYCYNCGFEADTNDSLVGLIK